MKKQSYKYETLMKKLNMILPSASHFGVGSAIVGTLIDAGVIKEGKMFGLPYFCHPSVVSTHIEVYSNNVQHSS